jgi:hypothetical protein
MQLTPELETILAPADTRLRLLVINEQTGEVMDQQYPGGTSTTQFTVALTPGSYRVAALYYQQENLELLGSWAADGSAVRFEAGSASLPQPIWLSRPANACSADALDFVERAGDGERYAMLRNCPTGELIISFDPSVTSPPSVMLYAERIGLVGGNYSFEASASASGTPFTLAVPPGSYRVTARSTMVNDISFYGAWDNNGLAQYDVKHKEQAAVFLTKPGDPCLDMYQLGASPDGRFPETKSYSAQNHCGEETSSAGDAPGLETLGNPDGVFNFEKAEGWYEFDDDNYEFEVDDGAYVMQAKKSEQNDVWGTNPLKLKDFYIEAVFRVGANCADNDRYGLLVRAPNPGYGYVVSMTCGERFRIYYMQDKKYMAVQEWKSSGEIDSGPNATNTLGVWMKGDTMRIYINGKLVGEYKDTTFDDEGILGLHLGAAQSADLEVRVEEVRYWDLSK